MKKFLILLTLDFTSKYLAAVIAPNNSFFRLHYNTGLAFDYDGGHFLTYFFPFLIIPVVAISLIHISPRSIPLMFAGIIGNLFCRFLPGGVVDFINWHFFTNNLADIYIWTAYGIMMIDAYKTKNYQDNIKLKTLFSKETV